jgi:hypothetical protein
MPRLASILCAVALLAACERPRQDQRARELAAQVLSDMLTYPGSGVVSVAAGEDAAEVVLTTPAGVDTVAAWYRSLLQLNGWELRQDAVSGEGTRIVYAVKGERPLWITLRRTAGAPGTTYTLIGAQQRDSAAARSDTAQRSGSSMSSNRIQRR